MIRQQIDSMILCKLGKDNQYIFYNNIYIIYSIKNQKKSKILLYRFFSGNTGNNGNKVSQSLSANVFYVPTFLKSVPTFWAKIWAANKLVQRKISKLNFIPP